MIILAILIWCSYCAIEGVRDGFTFHKAGLANNYNNKVLGFDIHFWFAAARVGVLLPLLLLTAKGALDAIVYLGGLSMLQPLISNGIYFMTRNSLDSNVYPKGFITTIEHSASSAVINVDKYSQRVALFITGLAFILLVDFVFAI
jgi:hypothetical protein